MSAKVHQQQDIMTRKSVGGLIDVKAEKRLISDRENSFETVFFDKRYNGEYIGKQ